MKLIKNLFSGWTPDRFLRLALGIIIGIIYVLDGQAVYLLFAVFLLVQAFLNMGCGCATSNCATASGKDKKTEYEFEKIKTREWTAENFKFATAVSVMYSSKIEGENIIIKGVYNYDKKRVFKEIIGNKNDAVKLSQKLAEKIKEEI